MWFSPLILLLYIETRHALSVLIKWINATRQTCPIAFLTILTNNKFQEDILGSFITENSRNFPCFLQLSNYLHNINVNHKKINSKDFYAFLIKKSERERESCGSGSYEVFRNPQTLTGFTLFNFPEHPVPSYFS